MQIQRKSYRHYQGKVFDLTVDSSHTYNVEGLGVHNSAAGSLVAYALGITQIDPIKYGLLFSRWLNEGRSATPLILSKEMRDLIIKEAGN